MKPADLDLHCFQKENINLLKNMHQNLFFSQYSILELWPKNCCCANIFLFFAYFQVSLDMVKNSISDAIIHQAQSRMHIIKDWYLISGNNTYITTWSILQCCVIVISSVCQVYFLRRLFRYTNVKPAKPRA